MTDFYVELVPGHVAGFSQSLSADSVGYSREKSPVPADDDRPVLSFPICVPLTPFVLFAGTSRAIANSVPLLGITRQRGTRGHTCEDTGVRIPAAPARAKRRETPESLSAWSRLDEPGPGEAVEYYAADKKVGGVPGVLKLGDGGHSY